MYLKYKRDSDGNYRMRSWPLTFRARCTEAFYAALFGVALAVVATAIIVPIILLTAN